MASRERQAINRNYIGLNFRIMQLLGIWNPYDHGISFWLYRFYTTIVYTSTVLVYTFLEIIDAVIIRDDLQLFTENICLTTNHLAGIAKIINLWMKKEKIHTIVDILERVLRQEDEGVIGRVQETTIGRAIWRGNILTTSFPGLVFLVAIAGMAYPVWDESYKERKFPYRFYPPINMKQSAPYWTSYSFSGISVIVHSFIIISHDVLFVIFMIQVVAQITILKCKVETLCISHNLDQNSEKLRYQTENRDAGSDKFSSRCTTVASRPRENNGWTADLISCIEYHQGIIRLVSELESIFGNVILLQFGTSLVTIGLTGFQVTVSTHGGRFLPMAGYLFGILVELFLYCWYGNEIIVESERLRTSAYTCCWYQADVKFTKILKIFLARMQKPLVVRAGNFCDLSLETFAAIVSRGYSYVAVLNQMNE